LPVDLVRDNAAEATSEISGIRSKPFRDKSAIFNVQQAQAARSRLHTGLPVNTVFHNLPQPKKQIPEFSRTKKYCFPTNKIMTNFAGRSFVR